MNNNNNYILNCDECLTKCDGVSKGNYQFISDVEFAEREEEILRDKINSYQGYSAVKSVEDGYPDITIYKNGELHGYLEVKAQRRTFMSVQRSLPNSNLVPSETLALNLSDLLRYFKIEEDTGVGVSIIWVLMNRPCLVAQDEKRYFHQKVKVLKDIYKRNKKSRKFRRNSGRGDVVNGVHKGVTVNYHFSIRELKEWKIK